MQPIFISIIAGLGGMFGWGISDFIAGLFSKRLGNFKTLFWSQLAALASSALLIFLSGLNFNMSPLIAGLIPLAAIFYAGAYLLFYKGYELGNISIVSATINLWAVFTMLFAFIFLGQRLSGVQLLGVILIISGVTLVSLKWSDVKNGSSHLLKGVKETVAAAILFGAFWNISDVITSEIGWALTTIFIKACIILFLILFALVMKREVSLAQSTNRTIFLVALVGILEAVGTTSFNWGLSVGDVILVTPIASALTIVTITMALVFLKEKLTRTQTLGMGIAIAGIILTVF